LGQWMTSRGLFTWIIVGASCILAFLFTVDPGGTKFNVADTVSHNNELVDVSKQHTYVLLLEALLCLFGLYLLTHRISKDMLRLVIGFDAAVITIASATAQFSHMHELVKNYSAANKFLPTIDLILIAIRNLLLVMMSFCASVMDSWTAPRGAKISVLILFIITLIFAYLSSFLSVWSKRETCFSGQCTTMKSVYLSSVRLEIIFAVKLLLPYARGHSYALLRFKAINPTRELYDRHGESVTWKGSRPSQDSAVQDNINSQDCMRSQYSFESDSACSHNRKNSQDVTDDHPNFVMLGRDLRELDEAGWAGDSPHQLSRPSEGGHVAVGGQYF